MYEFQSGFNYNIESRSDGVNVSSTPGMGIVNTELWCIVCIDVSVQRGRAGAYNEREKTAAIRAHTLRA